MRHKNKGNVTNISGVTIILGDMPKNIGCGHRDNGNSDVSNICLLRCGVHRPNKSISQISPNNSNSKTISPRKTEQVSRLKGSACKNNAMMTTISTSSLEQSHLHSSSKETQLF